MFGTHHALEAAAVRIVGYSGHGEQVCLRHQGPNRLSRPGGQKGPGFPILGVFGDRVWGLGLGFGTHHALQAAAVCIAGYSGPGSWSQSDATLTKEWRHSPPPLLSKSGLESSTTLT